jgi:hypothetical protein
MNIFEIFSRGSGRLNETNMSSALHFLLDPQSTHGLGFSSLVEFLCPISQQLENFLPINIADLTRLLWRCDVDLVLEDKHNDNNQRVNGTRKIDLVLYFRNKQGGAPIFVMAIENKIKNEVRNERFNNQLLDEYNNLRNTLVRAFGDTHIPVLFIFLTPSTLNGYALTQWNNLTINDKDRKFHYSWQQTQTNERSVVNILQNLIKKNNNGEINPSSSFAPLFLKSMLQFIANDFGTEEKKYGLENEENLENNRNPNYDQPITDQEFWNIWTNKHGEISRQLAGFIFNIVNEYYVNLGYQDFITFKQSRVVFFDTNNRVNKVVRIHWQHPTNITNVTVQFKINQAFEINNGLEERLDANGISIIDERERSISILISAIDMDEQNSIRDILIEFLNQTAPPN